MKTALIIGVNGYIGSHLAKYLSDRDWKVTGIGKDKKFKFEFQINYLQIDITDLEAVKMLNFEVDYVFHFAALTGTKTSFDDFTKFIDVNIKGLLNVLNCIRLSGYNPSFIFPSTRLVYQGNEEFYLTEKDLLEAKTIYAQTKISGEQYIRMYSRLFNLNYFIFRICVPYGNYLGDTYSYGTIGFFIRQATVNKEITIYGDGRFKRTFTHIEDIVRIIINAIELPEFENHTLNIGGQIYSLFEVARLIAERFNISVKSIDWPQTAKILESGSTAFNASLLEQNLALNYKNTLQQWIASLN